MGSIGAMSAGSANRYFQKILRTNQNLFRRVEGRVEYKGKVSKIYINYKVD